MTNPHTRLGAALAQDDEAFLKSLEQDQGLFADLGDTLHGPQRAWNWLAMGIAIVMSGLGFWSVYQMFQTETDRVLILWAAAAWASWTIQIQIKQWLYNRVNTQRILRALKAIDLRLKRQEHDPL